MLLKRLETKFLDFVTRIQRETLPLSLMLNLQRSKRELLVFKDPFFAIYPCHRRINAIPGYFEQIFEKLGEMTGFQFTLTCGGLDEKNRLMMYT
jgi:hypothetical protein